jgi:hypothetical protein
MSDMSDMSDRAKSSCYQEAEHSDAVRHDHPRKRLVVASYGPCKTDDGCEADGSDHDSDPLHPGTKHRVKDEAAKQPEHDCPVPHQDEQVWIGKRDGIHRRQSVGADHAGHRKKMNESSNDQGDLDNPSHEAAPWFVLRRNGMSSCALVPRRYKTAVTKIRNSVTSAVST